MGKRIVKKLQLERFALRLRHIQPYKNCVVLTLPSFVYKGSKRGRRSLTR